MFVLWINQPDREEEEEAVDMVEETPFNPVPVLAAVLVRLEPSRKEVEDAEPFLEERELAGLRDDFFRDGCWDGYSFLGIQLLPKAGIY